jgi:hypothetical protein
MPITDEILIDIGEHVSLDTDDVRQRHLPHVTPRRVRQVLHGLTVDGLLHSRTLAVWDYAHNEVARTRPKRGGRIPAQYFLTEDGGAYVAGLIGIEPRVLKSSPTANTLRHRRQCVKTRLLCEGACDRESIASSWILEEDQRADVTTGPPNQRKVLYHSYQLGHRRFTCQPDIAALLELPDAPVPLALVFEVDLSTEGTKQLRNKLPGLNAFLEQQSFHAYWPQLDARCVRVLWVFHSEARRENVVKLFQSDAVASSFRYGVFSELTADNFLREPVWLDRDGHAVSILR